MRRSALLIMVTAVVCLLPSGTPLLQTLAASAEGAAPQKAAVESAREPGTAGEHPLSASRAAREEKAIQDARRQQLAEREAALAAKEQELKKLSAKLEGQIKALEDARKRLDDGAKAQAAAQKKLQDEKMQKMVKLFKTVRGEQAGKLIDSMQEDVAFTLLGRLDTKTVAKLAPHINQPRILKWVTENIKH